LPFAYFSINTSIEISCGSASAMTAFSSVCIRCSLGPAPRRREIAGKEKLLRFIRCGAGYCGQVGGLSAGHDAANTTGFVCRIRARPVRLHALVSCGMEDRIRVVPRRPIVVKHDEDDSVHADAIGW
jgi:hypothetical protein